MGKLEDRSGIEGPGSSSQTEAAASDGDEGVLGIVRSSRKNEEEKTVGSERAVSPIDSAVELQPAHLRSSPAAV